MECSVVSGPIITQSPSAVHSIIGTLESREVHQMSSNKVFSAQEENLHIYDCTELKKTGDNSRGEKEALIILEAVD